MNNSDLETLQSAAKLKSTGDFAGAEKLLKQLIASQPHFAPAYNSLGSLYFTQGLWPDAENAYRTAIECEAAYTEAYYNLGLTLIRQQKFKEALTVFLALLELSPHHLGASYQLACLAMKQNKNEEAIRYFLTILKSNPTHLESIINAAACYLKLNQLTKAKEYYLHAFNIDPQDEQVLFNLGVIHSHQGLMKEAADYYSRAISVNSDYFDAYNNLGVTHIALNDRKQALNYFQQALRLQPHNVSIQHLVSVLSGTSNATDSPAPYIKSLFDDYAVRYDAHVKDVLHYQVPQIFKKLLSVELPKNKQLTILDLGCGTGLCGEAMKEWASSLTGVDLSANMLELAKQKHCYNELIESDIVSYLQSTEQHYDLVMAGDVLVYIGELHSLIKNVHKLLTENGLFIFNVEVNESKSFQLNTSGRFSHMKNYVQSILNETGFIILKEETVSLRKQEDEAVKGMVYLAKAV